MYGPVLYYDYTLHVLLLVTHTHLAVATILNTVCSELSDTHIHETRHNIRQVTISQVRTSSFSSAPPWYSSGYILLGRIH